MARFKLSRPAQDDLKSIRNYLFREAGPDVARYVIGRIREGVRLIAEAPGLGHFREDLADPPLRFTTVFSYMIIYNPTVRPIEVVRILHGHRDVGSIMDGNAD